MFAFWKYDSRFGCLGGHTDGQLEPGGRVWVKEYSGTIQPIILLKDGEGEKINRKLDELDKECNAEIKKIESAYRAKALAIAPFLKDIHAALYRPL